MYSLLFHSHVICMSFVWAHILSICTRMPFVCQSCVLICHLYVTRMYSNVIRMSLICTPVTFVCHSYVLGCHPYVTRMYSYVIRISLVCTHMPSVCHSYVLICHPYVIHMWFYHEPIPTGNRQNAGALAPMED